MSSILTIAGVMILSWCEVVKTVVPMVLMRIITSFANRYSNSIVDYTPDMSGVKTIAIVVIIAGVVLSSIFYGQEKNK